MEAEIIVVGAGAAGLLAARTLAEAGKRVLVLEARNRPGGRIYTFTDAGFSGLVEGGAEFLHGSVPLTRSLLEAAGKTSFPTTGTTYQVIQGELHESEDFIQEAPQLLEQLHALPHDMPLADFLAEYFPDEHYAPLREQVTRFAEGYDAADAQRASSFALRDELSGGGFDDSPHPEGTYATVINRLVEATQAAGGELHLGAVVQEINWQPRHVEVRTIDGRCFRAQQAVLTLPLGILQTTPDSPSHIRIEPELPEHRAAAASLGYGAVIKVLLEFETAFWEQGSAQLTRPMPELSFLFSDAPFPTWWSQLPDTRPLLTGWLAGPTATQLREVSEEQLLVQALDSLAGLLGTTPAFLRSQLQAHRIINWAADPYALGAYAYTTVGASAARATLAAPVADTLFFAGEGVYDGAYIGTVEAALVSGADAAQRLLHKDA
ncbi:FAD-dependent oxidoreductase [Hymenobacter tibetensis]|uniref:Tryptophan 2-monooxygenase n=2 Tax=Hymenobacter tibetensis TaxID=497967 RepID=A0ABY4D410_9BACT|nr:NAD(P)/FAD-dependent oxidoreductase [Hymenobacter tibetensis]UOG77253.1 FAD-dependent oxidoreductase [Hymenobacter tibetensis]